MYLFYQGSVIKLKDATPLISHMLFTQKIGNTAIGCEINGNKNELQLFCEWRYAKLL